MSIRINDLTVRFKNGVVAVNKASLEIPKGIYGLLGENGAGKTTLMRVLTTVLKQTEGMVSLDGILYNEGNYEKLQKKIGYLPQEIDLYPNLTVKECLVYMGGLSGVSRNDLEQRITYYLEKTSLTEHQNKKMRQLSGGMKRRVGLIQALLNNPDFLIIDEPLLENAKGCVWNCTVQNAEEARLLEANYSISSKQYVENGIHMKVLSKGKPNENCVLDNDITLEDAYIYLTNS